MRGRCPAVVPALVLALVVAQLAVATWWPGIDRFADKAFGARLVAYPVLMLVAPAVWWWATRPGPRGRPPHGAFALVMAPFLVDVTGNSLDLYDRLAWWDDANHLVNWFLLLLGIGLLLRVAVAPRWVLGLLVAGLGALLAIGWELGEWWTFIRHGTELDTAYTDTLGDLALGTLGGALAGVLVAATRRDPGVDTGVDPGVDAGAVTVREAGVSDLGWVEDAVRRCPAAMAEFGGFYGDARTRLAPLLGADRSLLLIERDGVPVGFLDVDRDPVLHHRPGEVDGDPRDGDVLGLSWFVLPDHRGRGLSAAAVALLAERHPTARMVVGIDDANRASLGSATRAGFAPDGRTPDGEQRWVRPPLRDVEGRTAASAGS